jgi:IS30 family transposase
MPKQHYRHVFKEERDMIAVLRGQGVNLSEIARRLGRDKGTICRELKRNGAPINTGYYLPHKANERSKNRNSETHRRQRLKEPRIRRYVRERLWAGWSPELTAGRWSKLHPECPVSYEAIYQWVYTDAREIIPFLVRAHKRRLRRGYSRRHTKAHIPNRIPLSERPAKANSRREVGHWETDTAVSRQSLAAIQISAERKTRYSKLAKLSRKSAEAMRQAQVRRFSRMEKTIVRSFTYDNGSENTEHELVNQALGIRSYFCAPYHSWEKGTVENTIGLIRRFLPKKTDFATITDKELRKIERWLNNRPRKCLNFNTPAEALRRERCT